MLTHVALEDSYVLGILVEPYQLELRMDFVLMPEHPNYHLPTPGEQECYRRGTIRVVDFRTLTWRASSLRPSSDAKGEIDYGCLDQMVRKEGMIIFRGDWGEIEVSGGTLNVFYEE